MTAFLRHKIIAKLMLVPFLLGALLTLGYAFAVPLANTWTIDLNLTATGGTGQINLTWTTTATNVENYRIHRSLTAGYTPGSETLIRMVDGSVQSYPDNDIDGRKTYYYRVEAVDGNGLVSTPSNEVSAQAQPMVPHGNYLSNNLYTCKFCHDQHESSISPLINKFAYEKELCYSCHSGVGQSIYKTDQEFLLTGSTHPVESESATGNRLICSQCHNPHGNINSATGEYFAKYIRSRDASSDFFYEGNAYCWACHGDKKTWYPGNTANETNPNAAGTGHDLAAMKPSSGTKVTCSRCHSPHGSSLGKILRTEINYSYDGTNTITATVTGNNKTQCYACHENLRADLTRQDYAWNGKAVNDGKGHNNDCKICHNPHGTANKRYLTKTYDINYSTARTTTFDANDFQACFTCHDAATFTGSGTGFKNGTTNLHVKHLSSLGALGNAVCKECHRPHGAVPAENPGQQHRVGFPATTVTAYGTNAKPLFNDAAAGGSCSLNCHGRAHDGAAGSTYSR